MVVFRGWGMMDGVSIRRTIESLLGDEQQQDAFRASPESFFAEHGMEDIPGELLGTAFVHYSDTAPIEHGDAVAGIATHYSAVPFEDEDLPDLASGDGLGDPFATLGLVHGEPIEDPYDSGVDDHLPDEPGPTEGDNSASDDPADDHDDDAFATSDADAGSELGDDQPAESDDIDSASYHDHAFDEGFDDGFDEAEALEQDGSGFGEGVGPTGILGEIHGEGPLDPGTDDPFFEAVTDDGLPTVHVDFEPIDFESETIDDDLGHAAHDVGHNLGHEVFDQHHVDTFDDVDPGDLDLDDF